MMYHSGLQENVFTEQYVHCGGVQLKLADSDLGLEQYRGSDYYVWSDRGNTRQLLFIFPTMVNLVVITLHYYHDSDSIQSQSHRFSKLKFYVVPDTFDIWDAPSASYISVIVATVPPGGEPAGRRNVSINVNFKTTKAVSYTHLTLPTIYSV